MVFSISRPRAPQISRSQFVNSLPTVPGFSLCPGSVSFEGTLGTAAAAYDAVESPLKLEHLRTPACLAVISKAPIPFPSAGT
ncbi:unnamed protein product [Musa acuminata subsp. burmannicoides]